MSLLCTWTDLTTYSKVSHVDFEQVITDGVIFTYAEKKIEYCQLKLPFSFFLGIFSDGGVVNWISALSIVLEYSNKTQHKSNKMYKKPTNVRNSKLVL